MGFGSFPAYDKLPYEKRIPGKGSRQKKGYLLGLSPKPVNANVIFLV